MMDFDNSAELVVTSLYEKTYSDIDRLRGTLPEPALKLLASEVLQRLSTRASDSQERAQAVTDLSMALIGPDTTAAAQLIEAFHRNGADLKSIHLDFLAPAAEKLGDWWDADEIHFSDVTVGTGRIYAIMRNLSRRFPPPQMLNTRHALFATVPGDNHTLGVRMAAELARKEGWDIDLVVANTHDELVERIMQSGHLIIGLSGGGEVALPALARLVLAIQVSQPAARLLVSGSLVDQSREMLDLMQIDAIENDFEGAMSALETFWSALSSPET